MRVGPRNRFDQVNPVGRVYAYRKVRYAVAAEVARDGRSRRTARFGTGAGRWRLDVGAWPALVDVLAHLLRQRREAGRGGGFALEGAAACGKHDAQTADNDSHDCPAFIAAFRRFQAARSFCLEASDIL